MLSPEIKALLSAMPRDLQASGARHAVKRIALSLIADPDLAKTLVAVIACFDGQKDTEERLVALLSLTLDEARMARENNKKSGASFIDAVEDEIDTRKAEGGLTDSGRLYLASCWVRAGLDAPEALATELDMLDDMQAELDLSGAPDIGPIIDKLIGEVSGGHLDSASALHTGFSELLATLPASVRWTLVRQTVARPKAVLGELGCALLLDRRSEIRQGALDGLSDRLDDGAMAPDLIAKLTVMRSWIEDDDTRSGIDTIVRKALRTGGGRASAVAVPKVHRALSSLVDGTGAQSMSVAVQTGGTRSVAVVLIKQGFGIKDAYVVPCSSASEQRRMMDMITSEVETLDVPVSYVADAIVIGIAEGLQAGHPPAPGLAGVAQVLGLAELRPRPATVSGIAALADPDGQIAAMSAQARGRLINASADWQERFPMIFESWYEDSDAFTDAIEGSRTPTAMKRALWEALEERRSHWAGVIARMAHMLHAVGDAEAIQFAAVAMALEEGRALKKTPVMEMIFDLSFEVWLYETTQAGSFLDEFDPGPFEVTSDPVSAGMKMPDIRPEKPGELSDLLKPAGQTEWWIDGYMMGVCTAPEFVEPGSWASVLLNIVGPDINSNLKLQRIMELMMLRYNGTLTKLRTPIGVALIPDDDFLISIWADGYLTAWEGNLAYWPKARLGKNDKTARKLLEDAASFRANEKSFRQVIPNWLRQRFVASS